MSFFTIVKNSGVVEFYGDHPTMFNTEMDALEYLAGLGFLMEDGIIYDSTGTVVNCDCQPQHDSIIEFIACFNILEDLVHEITSDLVPAMELTGDGDIPIINIYYTDTIHFTITPSIFSTLEQWNEFIRDVSNGIGTRIDCIEYDMSISYDAVSDNISFSTVHTNNSNDTGNNINIQANIFIRALDVFGF